MKRRSHSPSRPLIAVLLASALASLPVVSEAKLGGGSSGRSTAVTRSSPTISSSSSRIGGGGSAGMTRPDVMARARSTPPAGAGNYNGNYAGGTPMPSAPIPGPAPSAPRSGPGWGTVAGAAAVGAAAGYMLGDHNSAQPAAPAGTPLGNPAALGGQDAQRWGGADAQQPASHGSSGGGMGTVLALLLLTGVGFWAFRRYQASQQNGYASRAEPTTGASSAYRSGGASAAAGTPAGGYAGNNADIERIALKTFNELQDANNRGDLAFLRTRLDDLLYQQIEAEIRQRGGPGRTQVVSMRAEALDVTQQDQRRLVSIRYTGLIVESPDATPETLDEVWHFVDENQGSWRLAGIEQV